MILIPYPAVRGGCAVCFGGFEILIIGLGGVFVALDLGFSEDEAIFRKNIHEFFERRVAPSWVSIDERGEIPVDLLKELGKSGLIAMLVSPEYGGPGSSMVSSTIALEEAGYADPSLATAVYLLVSTAWPYMVQLYGSEEAKSEILPKVASGEGFFGIASTEAQGGSDIAGFRTMRASRRKDGEWVISGEKSIVGGMVDVERLPWGGGWFLITRSGAVDDRHRSLTTFAFLAKKDGKKVDGYEYHIMEEVGRHGVKTGSIRLSDVAVDDRYRLGEVNGGFRVAMQGFNLARCLVGAASVGAARWALDRGLDWLKQRNMRDRPLASYQGVNFRFADLYAELDAARLLCYKAAWLADRYYFKKDPTVSVNDIAVASACAKLKAPEAAFQVFQEVMKWHGGMSFFKDLPFHRGLLGVLAYLVGAEGSQNVMRYLIARNIMGPDYVPP